MSSIALSLRILNVLLVSTVAVLVACTDSTDNLPNEASVRPAKFIVVGEAESSRSNRFPTVIDAAKLSELSFEVGGLITSLPFRQAQEIKQGDVIAKLNQRDYQNKYDSAKAQYDNAETEYQRGARLAAQDALSKSVLEQRRTQRNIKRTQMDIAKKALDDTVLTAPFDGVIAQIPAKVKQNIRPGETVAIVMSDEGFEASIDVPSKFIARIPKGEQRQAAVILETRPNDRIEAKFKDASLIADSGSQTYAVSFSFLPPDDRIVLPGMSAIVEINYDPQLQAGRVAVPLSAIVSEGDQQYVWKVVDEDGQMRVSRADVAVEQGVGETVVITTGLKAGETIVGAGGAYLSEGALVRSWQ